MYQRVFHVVVGVCLAWGALHSGASAQEVSPDCTAVASVDDMQAVIDAASEGETACMRFDGTGGIAGWNLRGRRPLYVKGGQHIIVDCAGNDYSMEDALGKLTMERDSKLQYANCHLLNYQFPDTKHVYGTVHILSNSTFGMESCRFVLDLNDKYAPTLVHLQGNATFELGELVQQGPSAAVHIFTSAFDSLLGPQFRYEISESTAYCGTADDVVPSAVQLATANGPDVVVDSEIANGNNVAADSGGAAHGAGGATGSVAQEASGVAARGTILVTTGAAVLVAAALAV